MSDATECITCIITDFQLNLLSPAFVYLLSIERDWRYRSTVYQKRDNSAWYFAVYLIFVWNFKVIYDFLFTLLLTYIKYIVYKSM